MNFALRCVHIFQGVNSRAKLVTLAPGLRLERRFMPLAQEKNPIGQHVQEHNKN